MFPLVPIMCLTATANKSVVDDCIRRLQMKNYHLETQSFNRPNLNYYVKKKESDKKVISEISQYIMSRKNESGIVYCLSRKDTETIANDIITEIPSMKKQITFYHAEIDPREKEERQRKWSKGDIKVIW